MPDLLALVRLLRERVLESALYFGGAQVSVTDDSSEEIMKTKPAVMAEEWLRRRDAQAFADSGGRCRAADHHERYGCVCGGYRVQRGAS